MPKTDVTWDLSQLFPSMDDKTIENKIKEIRALVEDFESKYKGKITSLSSDGILECIKTLESFESNLDDMLMYAYLSFTANMSLPKNQALYDKTSKINSEIEKRLSFFSIELAKLVLERPEIINDKSLSNYKHRLECVERSAKHILSEKEEKLIIEKDLFGVCAWSELQGKWLNTRMFDVDVLGERKTLNYGDADGLLIHIDRKTRESANRSIYGKLKEDGEIFSSALRNICNDWLSVSKRRNYNSAMEASLVANDTDKKTIDSMMDVVENSTKLYQKYLILKSKIMGLEKLGNHDIVAPLPDSENKDYTFDEAKALVTKAYEDFDADYVKALKDVFNKNRIDAEPRFGKKNGAFCYYWYNGKSSFVLQSFTGTIKDVFTLAHELGHSTHTYYSTTNQTIMNTNVASVVAETASIFGELLLTDILLKEAKTDKEKRDILCSVLDNDGMTAFQVSARVWFEQSLYKAIDEGKYLDYNTICELWTAARDRIYGDSVEWLPEMESEWAMKPHYFMANYRFYNYPYVYAKLFVYSLYQKYLEDKEGFIPKFKKALSAGSSMSPLEIGKIFGFDVSKQEFWENGMKQFERFVSMLEEIIEK
ncbi:MAG: M3 family oligoendopeptidase [Candidatus Aenigmarchaeota archaeon]|nr:M3 family oligoendopeptidase [Candidatus Aenigmarchaeota archaeon]